MRGPHRKYYSGSTTEVEKHWTSPHRQWVSLSKGAQPSAKTGRSNGPWQVTIKQTMLRPTSASVRGGAFQSLPTDQSEVLLEDLEDLPQGGGGRGRGSACGATGGRPRTICPGIACGLRCRACRRQAAGPARSTTCGVRSTLVTASALVPGRSRAFSPGICDPAWWVLRAYPSRPGHHRSFQHRPTNIRPIPNFLSPAARLARDHRDWRSRIVVYRSGWAAGIVPAGEGRDVCWRSPAMSLIATHTPRARPSPAMGTFHR